VLFLKALYLDNDQIIIYYTWLLIWRLPCNGDSSTKLSTALFNLGVIKEFHACMMEISYKGVIYVLNKLKFSHVTCSLFLLVFVKSKPTDLN
jgi:hypothetical protein